jgi:hypothetical protein
MLKILSDSGRDSDPFYIGDDLDIEERRAHIDAITCVVSKRAVTGRGFGAPACTNEGASDGKDILDRPQARGDGDG